MDGLETTRKSRENGSTLPIAALTANAFVKDRGECRQAGRDVFLPKPFEPYMLKAAFARWVKTYAIDTPQ
jgi:CheY-like chemotaxis protein